MKISILTLFPEMFQGPLQHSIVKLAQEKNLVAIDLVNIRDFGIGKHKVVDDTPYGGGIGMVMRVDVVHAAMEFAKQKVKSVKQKVILLTASGETFRQEKARAFAKLDHLILVCGHYEGIDERICQYVDEQVSIGDFITTGGEIPAMLITDSVVRCIKNVLKTGVTDAESFSLSSDKASYLEYPQFTKPKTYEKHSVPDILLSGDHKKIATWREEQARIKTTKRRPDLLTKQ